MNKLIVALTNNLQGVVMRFFWIPRTCAFFQAGL